MWLKPLPKCLNWWGDKKLFLILNINFIVLHRTDTYLIFLIILDFSMVYKSQVIFENRFRINRSRVKWKWALISRDVLLGDANICQRTYKSEGIWLKKRQYCFNSQNKFCHYNTTLLPISTFFRGAGTCFWNLRKLQLWWEIC